MSDTQQQPPMTVHKFDCVNGNVYLLPEEPIYSRVSMYRPWLEMYMVAPPLPVRAYRIVHVFPGADVPEGGEIVGGVGDVIVFRVPA